MKKRKAHRRVNVQFGAQLCGPREWGSVGEICEKVNGNNATYHCRKNEWTWRGVLFKKNVAKAGVRTQNC